MSSESPTPGDFFPSEEIAQAVDACRKQDRRLDMYHKFASPTAKAFIELGFYSTHFCDKVDHDLYVQCRDAIATTLTEDDIRYLLRFETDAETKAFLEELLHELHKPKLRLRRTANAPAVAAAAAVQPPPVTPANPPPRIPQRPRRVRIEVDAGLLKLLVLLIVVGGILFYVVDFLDLDFFGSESRNPKREERKRENPTAVQTPPPAETPPFQTQKVVCAQQSAGKTSLPAKPDANAPLAATGIVQTATADASNVVLRAIEKQGKTRTRKLVLTDSTSIRIRPDGTIEVPRTFSYAGARLRKPFWIYDRQLEKSGRIENEARSQKAAMDKWKALYDEAVKMAEPPTPRNAY